MARFKNSNRIAMDQMAHTSGRVHRKSPADEIKNSYFRRIGFDFAMI